MKFRGRVMGPVMVEIGDDHDKGRLRCFFSRTARDQEESMYVATGLKQ